MTLSLAVWEQRAKTVQIETRTFINGQYTATVSGETFDCIIHRAS
jgi:4-guanidinobutyraldehyde dehydrogenase/NAD-dependent aldehyde dehydrogenase